MTKDFALTGVGSALKAASLRFRVIAAVTFGSQVKGLASPSSDLDVLVVAEGSQLVNALLKAAGFIGEIRIRTLDKGEFPARWQPDLLEAAMLSARMEPEVSLSRYPGMTGDDRPWIPSEEYKREDADEACQQATKGAATAGAFVAEWFAAASE